MFERAACPDKLPLTAEPFVTMEALAELSTLLDLALKDLAASSNARLSGASRTSHDQNRGEAHVTEDGDVSERMPALSAAPAAADGPVQDRPAGTPGAPLWPELPEDARSVLTGLMTQLILNHATAVATPPSKEDGHDQ